MIRPLLLVLLLCAACSRGGARPEESADEGGLRALPLDPSTITASYQDWEWRETTEADLDDDGTAETVVLASDVTLNSEGEPLWEDGHRWVLWVLDDTAVHPLYGAFVPRGRVEAAIGRPDQDGARPVLLLERTPDRIRVIEISYSRGTGSVLSEGNWYAEDWLVPR